MISLRVFVFAAGSMMALSARAQDLLENSGFDFSASGWETSIGSTWSNLEDHHGDPTGTGFGSVEISTSANDYAQQCVEVAQGEIYIVDAWVTKNPAHQFSPCSNPQWGMKLDYWADTTCTSLNVGSHILVPLSTPDGWFETNFLASAPNGTVAANVQVNASCPAHDGMAIFYFDDIKLFPDEILRADFEIHAMETGPGQSGG